MEWSQTHERLKRNADFNGTVQDVQIWGACPFFNARKRQLTDDSNIYVFMCLVSGLVSDGMPGVSGRMFMTLERVLRGCRHAR